MSTVKERAEKRYQEIKEQEFGDSYSFMLAKQNDEYADCLDDKLYDNFVVYINMGKLMYPDTAGKNLASKIMEAEKRLEGIEEKEETKKAEEKKEEVKEIKKPEEKKEEVKETKKPEEKKEEVKETKKPEEKKETLNFDTSSTFIPKQEKEKQGIFFDYDDMIIDINGQSETKKSTKSSQKRLDYIKDKISVLLPKNVNLDIQSTITGMAEAVLTFENKMVSTFMIDPNIIHGNGYYLIANSEDGLVPINLEERELVRKALGGFTLNKEESEKCRSYIYSNTSIYNFIDMSGDKFARINNEGYMRLGENLDNVLKTLASNNLLARYRFTSYKNPDEFVLKSDDKVKCTANTVNNLSGATVRFTRGTIQITTADGTISSCVINKEEK